MQFLDLHIEDLREAQQERRGHFSLKQSLDQGDDLDAHQRISRGMHCQAALFADSKVPSRPVVDSVYAVWDFAWRKAEALR